MINLRELDDRSKWMIVIGVVVFFVILIITTLNYDDVDLPKLDPYNHKSVALHFLMKNGSITKKMGKVARVSQIGDGGSGRVSHNVFKLEGVDEEKQTKGVCDLTLKKNDKGEYVITKAVLTMKGTEYNISLKGFKGRGKGMSVF